MASSDHSFLPVLRDLMNGLPTGAKVLEWGPGRSTVVMATEMPGADITSIEHNEKWFKSTSVLVSNLVNVRLIFQPYYKSGGGSSSYVTYPIFVGETYDLVFVDGRARADCLVIASLVLNDDGVVVLHDAKRKRYRESFSMFASVKDCGDTCVLSNPMHKVIERKNETTKQTH